MQPEDAILFACTRVDFQDEHQRAVERTCQRRLVNWHEVCVVADRHGVAPLVYTNLLKCTGIHLPDDTRATLQACFDETVARKQNHERQLAELLAYFNRQNTDVLLIKGAALDRVLYEQPWYTRADDVDAVLRRSRSEADSELLRAYVLSFKTVHFELDYFSHHDVTMNGLLPVDFAQIWSDATEHQILGERVLIPSREDLLIASCINSCRKWFFRLKNVLDIAEMTRQWGPTLDWNRLATKASDYQCQPMVYTGLFIASAFLNRGLDKVPLASLGLHPARARLLRSLALAMPFGRLARLYDGPRILGRQIGPGLILPYAAYSIPQVRSRIRTVLARQPEGDGALTSAREVASQKSADKPRAY